ncbi:MAG: 23S rRNA (guanosine(2251)-2'-O)-methyltransferase RlmB [Gammaproteobacteria bacterium]|nr:23S rRNA (guanosine(2251)-2'-O)-methyltransferase RlmB [Gammaproteobacteria bacterium]
MVVTDLVVGVHPVRHALAAAPERALELWLLDGADRDALAAIVALAAAAGVSAQRVPRRTLDRLAGDGHHQGVVLRQRPVAALEEADLYALVEAADVPLVLMLDGVNDPHNIGACLRTVNAVGATALVVPRHRGAGLTPAARKAASGAAELTPFVQVSNLARALSGLAERGIRRIAVSGEDARSLYGTDLTGPLALVLGAEDQGLRRLTREHCDLAAAIPMLGAVESLNVSVAAAVCLYETLRQRAAAG